MSRIRVHGSCFLPSQEAAMQRAWGNEISCNNPKPFFKGDPATAFSENIFVMQWLEWIRICFIATTQINWHNKHLKVKTAKGE